MKTLLIIILAFFVSTLFLNQTVQSQNTIWKLCLGGTDRDYTYSSQQTSDGGFILCGITGSNDGNISGFHGGDDIWIQKLDVIGNLEWQKCLGGSGMEQGWEIRQTSDGNYIIAGYTNSNNGDVTGNHGEYDAWVAKIDASGNLLWQRCFGGTAYDAIYSIQTTADNGYIVAGITDSDNGDVTGNHGEYDYWVLKLDATGNIEWQKCLGGNADDWGYSVIQVSDGSYMVTGETASGNGDVTGYHGGYDQWIAKLDATGNLLWQKCYGGSSEDGGTSVEQTTDGGFITSGYSVSNDGDVTGNHGGFDFWVVKCDESGNIIWQKSFGGSAMDSPRTIHQTNDAGYIGAGSTYSNNGDVSGNHGQEDGWLIKLDSAGNMEWQKCLGGSSGEELRSVHQTTDGGYFAAGYSFSDDYDATGNHGLSDSWALKLTGTLNIPVFDPPGKTSLTAVTFTIIANENTTIYYTTDGSAPDINSSLSGLSPLTLTTPGSTGTYIYKAIAAETDWTSSGVATGTFTILPTGIADNQENKPDFLVYPNPAEKCIHIGETNLTEAKIILINAEGNTIFNHDLHQGNPVIDISSFPKGIYLLKISGKETASGKFIEKTTAIVFE